jgi:histidyl-tRNA synthetase
MSATSLPGFRDFYPEEFAQRAWLFERWRDVARRFAFVEYDGPPLEPLELYTRKSGDEIVGQLYNFTDKGDREVALRPEMTPTVARMVGARANALRKPVRWFSIPQLFRYERQQKGRLREHFQLNVDIFGEADVSADAELLAIACEVMRACGLGPDDVKARVSDRTLLTALLRACGVPDEGMPAAFGAIDKVERDDRESLIRKMEAAGIGAAVGRRLLDLVTASDFTALREAFGSNADVAAALDRMDRYLELAAAHGVAGYVKLDLTIVRGLAYYTGIVFELFDAKGEFRAICGGGRYDTLLSSLGGADMPALGFGMGDVVLSELLKARDRMPSGSRLLDAWVAPLDGARTGALQVATALRNVGASVEVPLRDQALGKQLKSASTAGARDVVIVGPAFVARGEVEVKELAGGTQSVMSVDALVARYRERYRGAADRP